MATEAGIFERQANDLGRIDHTRLQQVLVYICFKIIAIVVRTLPDSGQYIVGFKACVDRQLFSQKLPCALSGLA
jgi:hypothetical protein